MLTIVPYDRQLKELQKKNVKSKKLPWHFVAKTYEFHNSQLKCWMATWKSKHVPKIYYTWFEPLAFRSFYTKLTHSLEGQYIGPTTDNHSRLDAMHITTHWAQFCFCFIYLVIVLTGLMSAASPQSIYEHL